MNAPKDLITTTEARKLLGVSTYKIKTLLEDGVIKHYTSIMDKRKKLVSRAEVERLKGDIKEAA